MKGLHVVFCLPGTCHTPTGGTKIVLEYANRLEQRGHRVTLVLPAVSLREDTLWHKAYRYGLFAAGTFVDGPRRWFPLSAGVRLLYVPDLSPARLPDADVIFATFWKTAEWVALCPEQKGRKHYLIQHHEVWAGPPPRVEATWKWPMKRIVPSRWLVEKARSLGVEAIQVPNAIDQDEFGVDIPIEARDRYRVTMLFSDLSFKASRDAVAGLESVRRNYPELVVQVFGAGRKPALPPGFVYTRQPTRRELRALYNSSALFVAPSHTEGWDLPATEAMLCGNALVASAIDGHREYAVHEGNALLYPPGSVESLAASVRRLIDNDDLRGRLALAGSKTAQQFTWQKAVDAIEKIFLDETVPEKTLQAGLS